MGDSPIGGALFPEVVCPSGPALLEAFIRKSVPAKCPRLSAANRVLLRLAGRDGGERRPWPGTLGPGWGPGRPGFVTTSRGSESCPLNRPPPSSALHIRDWPL